MTTVITEVCNIFASESKLFAAAVNNKQSFVYGGFLRLLAQNVVELKRVQDEVGLSLATIMTIIGEQITDVDLMFTSQAIYQSTMLMADSQPLQFRVDNSKKLMLQPYGSIHYHQVTERVGDWWLKFDVSRADFYQDKYDYVVNTMAYNRAIGLHSTAIYNGSWAPVEIEKIIMMCERRQLVPLFRYTIGECDDLSHQSINLYQVDDWSRHEARYKKMLTRGYQVDVALSYAYSQQSGVTALSITMSNLLQSLSARPMFDFLS